MIFTVPVLAPDLDKFFYSSSFNYSFKGRRVLVLASVLTSLKVKYCSSFSSSSRAVIGIKRATAGILVLRTGTTLVTYTYLAMYVLVM